MKSTVFIVFIIQYLSLNHINSFLCESFLKGSDSGSSSDESVVMENIDESVILIEPYIETIDLTNRDETNKEKNSGK